jgi:hypothetical protein
MDMTSPAATTLAENIFVIVEKLPLMLQDSQPGLFCIATEPCNGHANRQSGIALSEISQLYQPVNILAVEDG